MSQKRHPQTGVKRERLTVRVGPLERTFAAFNKEIGDKTAAALVSYDHEYVAPLRERLDWIEKPLVVRAWTVTRRTVVRWVQTLRRRVARA